MFSLSVKNNAGDILELTNNKNYDVIGIDGLTPASVTIGTNELGGYDGSIFETAKVGSRNIVLIINLKNDLDNARIKLYKYFVQKECIRLYFSNSVRTVYIDGYVETYNANLFDMIQTMQISVICPKPFFIEQNEYEITHEEIVSLFEFPFEIPLSTGIEFSSSSSGYNNVIAGGDVSSGIIFEITALSNWGGTVSRKKLVISNNTTGKVMTISDLSLAVGEKIYINTFDGCKQILSYSENTVNNIMHKYSGDWIDIQPGNNAINITDSTTNYPLKIVAQAYKYYSGV